MENSTITTEDEKAKWAALRKNLTQSQVAEEKSNPPIDNVEKNSYITDTGSTTEPIKNLLDETFKGDVNKLAEAYVNSQKSAVKMAQQLKELKQLEEKINEMGTKDPLFLDIIDAVKKGEDIRSRLEKNEPHGKQEAPVTTDKPKNYTEAELVKMGLLTPEQLSTTSTLEKEFLVYRAKLEAEARAAAESVKNEVLRSTQEMRKKEQEELEKAKLQQLAEERYDKSLEAVVTKYGVDFSGEHASLLDEIHEEMIAFRDPKDARLIHQKAFELAFQNVAERKNIQLEKQTFGRPPAFKTETKPGIGKKPETKELTFEEQMLVRQAAKFVAHQEKTQSLYKKF